jgi:hypothetical protein
MKKVLLSLVLAALVLALATPAYAGDALDGKVVIGEDFTLKSGETIQGDLVVMGGNATVEAGARVDGNVVVMGGSADIAGRVDQNVTVLGDSVTLRSSAEVDGQLTVWGGSITREEGAQVKGGESQGFSDSGPWDFPGPRFSPLGAADPAIWFIRQVIEAIMTVVLVSVLALVITALWPEQTMRVSAAIATAPAVSGLLGLLTLLAVPIVLGLIAVTICLAPLSLLGFGAYIAAVLFGWIGFGLLLGNRLAVAFRWNLPPAGAALLGTFIISALVAFFWPLDIMACFSFALSFIFACIGLGGVVLTRFGTTPYLSGAAIAAPPVPPAPPAPPRPPMPLAPAAPAANDITMFAPEPAPAAEPPTPPAPPAA